MSDYDTVGVRYDSGLYFDGFAPPATERTHMAKAKLGLDKLNSDGLAAYAATIKTAMTGNANFTTPNPTLASVGTAITALQTKLAAYNTALAAASTALADRDAADAALRALLVQLAAYVDNVSGGDRTKIESSAMGVRNGSGAIGTLNQVQSLVVKAGAEEGSLDTSWDPTRGAIAYVLESSVDPITPTSWTYKMTAGRSDALVNSFASGTKQWIRVRAIGANNQMGPWSDPAAKTVP